jgi:hypothetical protein
MSKRILGVQFLSDLVTLSGFTGSHRPVGDITLPAEGDTVHHQQWKGWGLRIEGPSLFIRPADKASYKPLDVEIEVPRSACAVTWELGGDDSKPVARK